MIKLQKKHRAISKATGKRGKNTAQQNFDVCALIDALEGMIWQYCGAGDGLIYHDNLSNTGQVFDVLGLKDGMAEEEMQAVLANIKRAVCKK